MSFNELAEMAYENALKRRKITSTTDRAEMHKETYRTLYSELVELKNASEVIKSLHLPEYTEAAEELVDNLIGCLTELHRRKVDIDKIVMDKLNYNMNRL